MSGIARMGDGTTGVCDLGLPDCPHTRIGTVSVTSGDTFVNGLGLHRLSDTGPTNCPHSGTFASVQGSGTVFCNGLAVVRIGDTTVCQSCGKSGSHTGGSGNVFAGG